MASNAHVKVAPTRRNHAARGPAARKLFVKLQLKIISGV
jgi:hypothetical protein